jgi:integrase
MPRVAKELGALQIKRLTTPGYHPVGKVPGLILQVTSSGARSWILRVMVGTRRREIGLGQYPAVGLALAHQKAQALRDTIAGGVDPVAARASARQTIVQQQVEEKALAWTFRRCAEAYIKAMTPGWRNAKHAQQWANTLATYVYPTIGDLTVNKITIAHVTSIIEPHWATKNETINRVRNRIELVLDWATVREYRTGNNPARWKGNLDKLFAERSVVAPVTNHRALESAEIFGFMEKLGKIEGISARCLEFVILTVCRSGEARLATWSEINWKTQTWHIEGTRMKSGRPHRVPLSSQAIALLRSIPQLEGEPLIFPGRVAGKPLSDMALTAIMRRMGVDAVPHGCRSTFSSWCASSMHYPSEVREMALAHAIGNNTVAAYQRSDLFEKRRKLIADWATFVHTVPVPDEEINVNEMAPAQHG